jgi:hypothetical protein
MSRQRVTRIFVGVFFVGLLATPLAIRWWSEDGAAAQETVDRQTAVERYGFAFEEVAAEAGVDFTHHVPSLDPKLDHIMDEVASMGGASVSVVDYNRDGWSDLYVTNSAHGKPNALYKNEGDGTFTNVAPELGLADLNTPDAGVSMGAVWGDYNNDGYEDLFLYRWGRPELYRNDQGEGFTRVTEKAGLPDWINANTAVWFDYDRDGRLDLFVGGFYAEDVDLWNLETTRMMPESFEYATNGGRNYLFHNLGNGRFEEVSEEMGLTSTRWTLAAVASDLRGTGYPDLYVANDYGVDEIYLNQEGKGFEEAGKATRIGFTPKSGMNASLGDVLNRGEQAIYVSNITEEGVLMQGNNLWMPQQTGERVRFQNMAGAMEVERAGWSYGAQFGDLNNDGWLDLYVANGYVSREKGASYWYDFSKVAGGHQDIIADARNWPDMEGRSLSGHQRNRVWLNDGRGTFQEVAEAVGSREVHDGRGVAMADLWNRGALDVIVANQGGPLQIYKTTAAPENEWVAFELTGTESNRSAIGTRVTVHWNDQKQVQTLTGGSGFGAQNQRRLHFGLGPDPSVEKAVVQWPSGQTQAIDSPEPGTVHEITEPAPATARAGDAGGSGS